MSRMHAVGQPYTITPPSRVQAGRRVRAARLLAGGVSLRDVSHRTGLSYLHLSAVERGAEPLLPSDARDLAVVLRCPEAWLRHGWDEGEVA